MNSAWVGASFGLFLGIAMINAFVMATLDTAVRLSRFLVAFDPARGPNRLLGGLAAVLLVLAVVVAYDAVAVLRGKRLPGLTEKG